MSSHRYHAHIICVAHNQPRVLDSVAIFFQTRAFLTYDVATELPQAFLYGRQCIEACDYTIVVVGDSYGVGTAQNMGVSQMHLSYLSARAKLKPMLVLIKSHKAKGFEVSRQLQEFTHLIEQQVTNIHYYDDTTNINQLLSKAYQDMTASCELKASWVKSVESNSNPLISKRTFQYANSGEPTLSTDTAGQSSKNPITKRSNNQNFEHLASDQHVDDDNNDMFQVLSLTESFVIKYSAHAYEGGNLTDITMTMEITWLEVLQALAKMPAASSSYGLQSCLNRLIAPRAEHDIKQKMPNVHAVARCQIAQNYLYHLQRSIIVANWIELTKSSVNASQQMWKLTSYAKKIYRANKS